MKRMLFPILVLFLLVACEKDQVAVVQNEEALTTAVDLRDDNTEIAKIDELITLVEGMNIPFGLKKSILVQLRNIQKKLERGQTEVALTMLEDLAAHIEELAADGTIDDTAEIQGLLDDMEWVRCEVDPECENLLSVEINAPDGTYTLYVHPYDQRTGWDGETNANGVAWDPLPFDGDINDVNFPSCDDLPNHYYYSTLADFDGEANTDKIVCALGDQGGIAYAAKVCADLNLDEEAGLGYEGWYLPSLGELKAIYEQLYRDVPGGNTLGTNNFNGFYYWSSSEGYAYHAWGQHFSLGDQTFPNKADASSSCRCVRR